MKRLFSGDEVFALRLAALDKILARHLQCGLDRFGSPAHKEDVRQTLRRIGDQGVREFFSDLGSEEVRMRVGELVDLVVQSPLHVRMVMPEA